jgi:uncharacterized protein DUF397
MNGETYMVMDQPGLGWKKSSRSMANNQCIEVALVQSVPPLDLLWPSPQEH